ncbi:unnamed protein product [Darwinula stevensoni]|uniref:Uncharacterized protein n=1 Tax=Darwinula stevensoni TaxID=69355 RepID=A0A7R8XBH9_9CRUS|nr:unnamed protein product [Darwinula stevensoni]CAG0886648.1 unnamed protein product [Darwinula stevensoni]
MYRGCGGDTILKTSTQATLEHLEARRLEEAERNTPAQPTAILLVLCAVLFRCGDARSPQYDYDARLARRSYNRNNPRNIYANIGNPYSQERDYSRQEPSGPPVWAKNPERDIWMRNSHAVEKGDGSDRRKFARSDPDDASRKPSEMPWNFPENGFLSDDAFDVEPAFVDRPRPSTNREGRTFFLIKSLVDRIKRRICSYFSPDDLNPSRSADFKAYGNWDAQDRRQQYSSDHSYRSGIENELVELLEDLISDEGLPEALQDDPGYPYSVRTGKRNQHYFRERSHYYSEPWESFHSDPHEKSLEEFEPRHDDYLPARSFYESELGVRHLASSDDPIAPVLASPANSYDHFRRVRSIFGRDAKEHAPLHSGPGYVKSDEFARIARSEEEEEEENDSNVEWQDDEESQWGPKSGAVSHMPEVLAKTKTEEDARNEVWQPKGVYRHPHAREQLKSGSVPFKASHLERGVKEMASGMENPSRGEVRPSSTKEVSSSSFISRRPSGAEYMALQSDHLLAFFQVSGEEDLTRELVEIVTNMANWASNDIVEHKGQLSNVGSELGTKAAFVHAASGGL